jgi:hypothetical protein
MNIPLKLSIAIVLAGSFVAATLCSVSAPRAAGSGGFETSVNRTNKGDRLESVMAKASPTAPQHSSISVGRRPIGCEPAFSPLAEPGRKQFYGRCVS